MNFGVDHLWRWAEFGGVPPRSFVRWERCAFHEVQIVVAIASVLVARVTGALVVSLLFWARWFL
jgi:hypothetical protein